MSNLGALISCKEASRAISQALDGKVSFPLHLRIRLHLLLCEACKRFESQVHFLRRAMRSYRQ